MDKYVVSNEISYLITISDIINGTTEIISNKATNVTTNYGLEKLDAVNNIFSPLSSIAILELSYIPRGNNVKLIQDSIREGNIVRIDEVYNGSQNTVFVGYIAYLDCGGGIDSGTNITLYCLSLLAQLATQSVVNDIDDTLMLGGGKFTITDFAANKVELGKILLAFQSESLMSYALDKKVINSYEKYNDNQLAFALPQGMDDLNVKSEVYFFGSTEENRFDSLLRTVYAYQRLIYQDLDGVVKIAAPSIKATAISDFYHFDIGGFGDSIAANSIPYSRYHIRRNAGVVCNRAYASLIPVGVNIIGQDEQNTVNYVAKLSGKLFTRGQQLYNTGLFTITKHRMVDLSENVVKDPMLLRLFDITKSNNSNITTTNISGGKSKLPIVGLYANCILSQNQYPELQLELEMPRLACYNGVSKELTAIPLGHMVNVNDNGSLALETSKLYCYQAAISYSVTEGSKLSLGLCKPFCFTPLWEQ